MVVGKDQLMILLVQVTKYLHFNQQLKRDVVATIVYEITPNPSDHK